MAMSLPKSKYATGMLYFLTGHTLIIYVQYIKSSKRKTSYILEKLFAKVLVHFVLDSIQKNLTTHLQRQFKTKKKNNSELVS